MSESKPRVLLADDYPRLLTAWRRLLEPWCEIVGTVANGGDVLEASARLKPDVIVLDLGMLAMDPLDACRQIKLVTPATKVVLVSAADAVDVRRTAMQNGASAFVLKHSVSELERAIKRAVAETGIA